MRLLTFTHVVQWGEWMPKEKLFEGQLHMEGLPSRVLPDHTLTPSKGLPEGANQVVNNAPQCGQETSAISAVLEGDQQGMVLEDLSESIHVKIFPSN
ncbi:Hypothetical predicted protein [Scomber scombrus]|uniref:Uncharacterized protein n=1 Tax=Scomber scombrus TaxID=13677 RepID=A0AAV1PGN3_SCOSC